MTLITAGYLQANIIAENYLMLDYIPEYSTGVTPVAVTVGDKWIGQAVTRKRINPSLIRAVIDWLEVEAN